MKRIFVLLVFTLAMSSTSFGQIEKILNQDFNVDNVTQVKFDLARSYYVEKWAGTTILVETKIKLTGASPSILKFALESGRYELLLLEDGDNVVIRSKIEKPPHLKNKSNEIQEDVEVRIMVPEDFNTDDISLITREKDTNSSTIKTDED